MITRVGPTHNFHAFDVWTCLQTEGVAALSLDIGDHFPDLETGHYVGRSWVTVGGLEVILGVYKELVKQAWLKKKLRRIIEEGIKTNAGWRTDDNWKMNNLNRKGRKKGTIGSIVVEISNLLQAGKILHPNLREAQIYTESWCFYRR
jgi:hypothetical protein